MYQKVESKDLKNFGKKVKGDLHLTEGVYTTFDPGMENELFLKVRKEKKATKELIDNEY